MGRVGIVTDSTCDLGMEWLAAHDVEMVPLTVFFGEEGYLDWVEMSPQRFYERLAASKVNPKTSQPSPASFATTYRALAEAGCDEIVSIHLTAALSGTYESAMLGAKESPVPVRVVDTKKVTQAAGLVVKAAVEARDAGADAAAVEEVALTTSAKCRLFFVLETLDYLVRGGRAGKAAGLAASLLNIKPVLEMSAEGVVEPFRKVKGMHKAISELAAHVADDAAKNGRMRAALLHACKPEAAEALEKALADAGADVEIESIGLVGSVIGTYAGPGAVGLGYYPLG